MKHRQLRRALALVVLALLVGVLAACGGDDEPAEAAGAAAECQPEVQIPTLEEGKLKIVAAQYPPLITYENGELAGVDGELMKLIAERACLEIEVELQSFAGVIESVAAGRSDVAIGGWYITPDREDVVDQSEPVYSDPPVIVAKEEITSLDDVDGNIGTTQGYLWVEDLKAYAGNRAKLYQSPDAVFADVANGRIAAGLMAVAEASHRIEQNPDAGLTASLMEPLEAIDASVRPSVTNFPHRKDVEGVTEALNAEIERLRSSGDLARILEDHGIDGKAAEVGDS
ncbi:MAG TPA: transporter substrate-binding domain-containing protein [Gaiellaceae bacterium]|nr:transporter substrate-binding domain-containing protein [Gaiellaceae bacterium]